MEAVFYGMAGSLAQRGNVQMKRETEAPPSDAVVLVLGARVLESGLSATLRRRVEAAAAYLKANPAAVCITTGGKGKDEPCAEGDAAKWALEQMGIEAQRIAAETHSRTTLENLRFSRQMLEEMGRGPAVVLATQRYHMCRACMIARHVGLEPYPLHAEDNRMLLPKNVCREVLATLKFLLLNRKGGSA